MFRRTPWVIAVALAAACAPNPAQPEAPSAEPGALPPKAWFVDKENLLDGALYPGQIDPAEPAFRLAAVGTLPVTAVSADASLAGYAPARAVDGDQTTQWAHGVYRAATGWLQASLATPTALSSIRVKMKPLAGGAVFDVQVLSGGVWTNAATGLKNTTWNTETKTFPARTGSALRLVFRNDAAATHDRFQVFELQPVGEQSGTSPSPTPTSTPVPGPTGSPTGSAYYPDVRAVPPGRLMLATENGRRVVRFDNRIPNIGNGHFQVRAYNAGGTTRAFQEILDPQGRVVASRSIGTFVFHAAHNHFHIADVSLYQLRINGPTGTLLKQGYKVSFCLLDSERFLPGAPTSRYGGCNQLLQGITRGWADLYDRTLPGQEFDVTGYAAGTYYIVSISDPTNKFADTNRENEVAWTKFTLSRGAGTLYVTGTSGP